MKTKREIYTIIKKSINFKTNGVIYEDYKLEIITTQKTITFKVYYGLIENYDYNLTDMSNIETPLITDNLNFTIDNYLNLVNEIYDNKGSFVKGEKIDEVIIW